MNDRHGCCCCFGVNVCLGRFFGWKKNRNDTTESFIGISSSNRNSSTKTKNQDNQFLLDLYMVNTIHWIVLLLSCWSHRFSLCATCVVRFFFALCCCSTWLYLYATMNACVAFYTEREYTSFIFHCVCFSRDLIITTTENHSTDNITFLVNGEGMKKYTHKNGPKYVCLQKKIKCKKIEWRNKMKRRKKKNI